MKTAYQFPIRIYWEDTDAGGIVFYANYLKFFERARTEWLRSLGIEQHSLKDECGGMFVVSETQVKYFSPARLDDLLEVTAQTLEAGRASMVLTQQAWLKAQGERKLVGKKLSLKILVKTQNWSKKEPRNPRYYNRGITRNKS